ncbi:hypothetical protein CTAYLR_002130 [Chrysophaeum taylorii]|uniref:THO complex subunit 1 n=1 Tax=Chrysophaeum taylorii TaxID=2483200 RepID=A0AAD7UME6_9STRA|nr:hypothetical protein CTAYLR_002130 [Chrysophaeum taylorii]
MLAEEVQAVIEACARSDAPVAACAERVVGGVEADAVELAARQATAAALVNGEDDVLEKLVSIAVAVGVKDPASFARVPFHVLEDILDGSPESEIERWWVLVEKEEALRATALFSKGKFVLLRFCNGLLKRVRQKPELCGRILIFLSMAFPLSERSAVNVKGEVSDTRIEISEEDEDTEDAEYSKFWRIQKWLSNPQLELTDEAFRAADDALSVLESVTDFSDYSTFFAGKYLTDPNLLRTQLRDPLFRMQVATQMYMVFDYLWHEHETLRERTDAVRRRALSIVETHDVKQAGFLTHLASRERFWVQWKKDGCPPYERYPSTEEDVVVVERQPYMPPIPGKWEPTNVEPPYSLEELKKDCERLSRVPTLEEHLKKWEEADDPANGIEEAFHPRHDQVYAWRAMRLVTTHRPRWLGDMRDGDVGIAVKKLQAERAGIDPDTIKGNDLNKKRTPPVAAQAPAATA